ncbi:hypothetical protein [Rhizobium giardinii]|uniref:Uncharacterized protein n=1 Tax=Rhizobium giardinii TaxID=56731 RepID=A0A7W8X6R8_9HYPH|nr:hypothetical protein [Rhizobium giardinii]MBB5534274.1 hypothetical protein [Rhizobium giardinii]
MIRKVASPSAAVALLPQRPSLPTPGRNAEKPDQRKKGPHAHGVRPFFMQGNGFQLA